MTFAAMMLVGLVIDALVGWPPALFARISHPVVWIGRAISACEARWNKGARFRNGAVTTALVIGAAALPALLLQSLLPQGPLGVFLGGVLAWPLIAARSLYTHVDDVARPLATGDLPEARRAVSMIVGRDPEQMDSPAVARAALESLAENASDGVVAPLFWGAIGGLPGIAAYKTVNTLDSMIGHRNDRYELFGKAAARLDDAVNWLPARITAVLFLIASFGRHSLSAIAQDARRHRSPNAGWPEGAMARAQTIRLSGPRVYGDRVANEPWLNADAPDPEPEHLNQGLELYWRAMVGMALVLLLLSLL